MPVFDIFSKRQKRERGEIPDVYRYDDIPSEFRVQVIHILNDTLGEPRNSDHPAVGVYDKIRKILCREYGTFYLSNRADSGTNSYYDVTTFLLECDDYESVIDVIETSFFMAEIELQGHYFTRYWDQLNLNMTIEEAISELNKRFLEHGLGYQYETPKIIRIDSKLLHAEVVKPTLLVLREEMYNGANDEYLTAHKYYREGNTKDCIIYCLKSFESVMKAICIKHKWEFAKGDTASRLLSICFSHNLIPTYLQSHYNALRSSLESGVPTVRNELAGHGQGSEQVTIPPYMASYLLHLTATSILFLADAEKEVK